MIPFSLVSGIIAGFHGSSKVTKLDIDAQKVLIFVSCDPEKPNHPSNISDFQWYDFYDV